MRPPRSRTNPIKTLINKMPASGAREKSTGRIERRITDPGLAYTSTPSKEKEKLFIYCLPASRVWVSLSISIHLYNCALIYSSTPVQRKQPITCLWEHASMEYIPAAFSFLSYRIHTYRFSWPEPEIEVWEMGSDLHYYECQKNIMLYRNLCSYRLSCSRKVKRY